MTLKDIVGQNKELALDLMNHVTSFPTALRSDITTNSGFWIDNFFIDKIKLHQGYWVNILPSSKFKIIPDSGKADIFEEPFRILYYLKKNIPSVYDKFFSLMSYSSHDVNSIQLLIKAIASEFDSIEKKYENNSDLIRSFSYWLLNDFLPYKLKAYYLYNHVTLESLPKSANYPNILLEWISQNIVALNSGESVLKNIIIGFYLFFSFMELKPSNYAKIFINLIDENNILSNRAVITPMLKSFETNTPDLIDTLNSITGDFIFKEVEKSTDEVQNKVVENYSTKILSEENRNDTIVFGDNIIKNIMSVQDFIAKVKFLDLSVVYDYLSSFVPNTPFTFNLSEQTKMYLTDSSNIQMCDVITKHETRTVIRYDGDSSLFVIAKPLNEKNIIYGISLDTLPDDIHKRKVITIEQKENEPIYKFLAGEDEYNGYNS